MDFTHTNLTDKNNMHTKTIAKGEIICEIREICVTFIKY